MAHLFSAARLRRSPCFCRLTGVSLAVFDDMLAQLWGPWDTTLRLKAEAGSALALGRDPEIADETGAERGHSRSRGSGRCGRRRSIPKLKTFAQSGYICLRCQDGRREE